MKPTKEIIEEAARHGIVEGALVDSAQSPNEGYEDIVTSPEDWVAYDDSDVVVNGRPNRICLRFDGKWARVITPAPAKEPPKPKHALKEGDYVVRTDEAMHERLMALCDAAGVEVYDGPVSRHYNEKYNALFLAGDGTLVGACHMACPKHELTETEFVAAVFGVEPKRTKELTLEAARELLKSSIRIMETGSIGAEQDYINTLAEYGITKDKP